MKDNIQLPLDDTFATKPTSEETSSGKEHSTGILPCQVIEELIECNDITSDETISKKQIQPASLDLRLGKVAYRVRASFLPGPGVRVEKRLKSFKMHEIDLSQGAVLEKGCVYVIPLCETLRLKKDISGLVNPKSSAGRLDIFTRVISDGTLEFDTIGAGYKGPIYAEIIPLTFSVKVRSGTTLSQLRLRKGAPPPFETDMRRLHESLPLVGAPGNSEVNIKKTGVAFTVDLEGDGKDKLIGYRAKNHAGVIDVDKINHYEPLDFWDPIYKTKENRLILDIDEFYILASKETVTVPPTHAAEMRAYDTSVGEFRVHYAGFFDPGFGYNDSGAGSRAVLEVRSHDVPFVLEDRQRVGRLVYERLTAIPNQIYGTKIGSNYQSQKLKLSKHFK